MTRPKRYRNFLLQTVDPLGIEIAKKARVFIEYEKDGERYYHLGLYQAYSIEAMKKLTKCDIVTDIVPSELSEYTYIRDFAFGVDNVRHELERLKQDYEKKVNRGKLLYEVIMEGDYAIDILPPDDKECLRLFTEHQRKSEEVGEVELYPWQNELLKELERPTARKVIWVFGTSGYEGKTWIQSYIEKKYGSRVYRSVLTNKADNMCYVLGKQLLPVKDIFLFNIARSDHDTVMYSDAYQVIEGIKDGCYFSGKYNSQQLHFKTPNTVIIFANKPPEASKLSKDRWIVYEIKKDLTMERNHSCLIQSEKLMSHAQKRSYRSMASAGKL